MEKIRKPPFLSRPWRVLCSQHAPLFIQSRRPALTCVQLRPAKDTNGGVVKIIAAKKINNVEAWLGNNNWLYITIPDTSISTLWLNRLKKNLLVEKTEFFRYAEAVQVTLKLREKMDHVEIIRYPDDNNIYIALFEDKSRSE